MGTSNVKSLEAKIKKLRRELTDEEGRADDAQIKIRLTEEWIREQEESTDEKKRQLILDNLHIALSREQDRKRISEQRSLLIREALTAVGLELAALRDRIDAEIEKKDREALC